MSLCWRADITYKSARRPYSECLKVLDPSNVLLLSASRMITSCTLAYVSHCQRSNDISQNGAICGRKTTSALDLVPLVAYLAKPPRDTKPSFKGCGRCKKGHTRGPDHTFNAQLPDQPSKSSASGVVLLSAKTDFVALSKPVEQDYGPSLS